VGSKPSRSARAFSRKARSPVEATERHEIASSSRGQSWRCRIVGVGVRRLALTESEDSRISLSRTATGCCYFFLPAFRFAQYAFIRCAAALRAAADQPRPRCFAAAPFDVLEDWVSADGAPAGDWFSGPSRASGSQVRESLLDGSNLLSQFVNSRLSAVPDEGLQLICRK